MCRAFKGLKWGSLTASFTASARARASRASSVYWDAELRVKGFAI